MHTKIRRFTWRNVSIDGLLFSWFEGDSLLVLVLVLRTETIITQTTKWTVFIRVLYYLRSSPFFSPCMVTANPMHLVWHNHPSGFYEFRVVLYLSLTLSSFRLFPRVFERSDIRGTYLDDSYFLFFFLRLFRADNDSCEASCDWSI